MELPSGGMFWTGTGGKVSAAMNSATFPLHYAAREGRSRIVRLLLERGYSASALDGEGLRAADRAREAGHFDLADELEDRGAQSAPGSPMQAELERLSTKELSGLVQGKPDALMVLIAAGRVHAIDGKGDTPLHICAAVGRLQCCDLLIKAGADPAAMNFERKKPHDRASENGHVMVAGLLRSLLPAAGPENAAALVSQLEEPHERPFAPEPVPDTLEEAFDFEDFDLDFDGEEEAEDFHLEIERDDYVASFDAVEGRVTRLGDEDGADLDFDDLGDGGFRITAEDIVGPRPQTWENADAATFRTFLDVRMGRRSPVQATAPTTRYHAISDVAVLQWVESVLLEGACTDEDVDALIGNIRGSFDAESIRGNLVHELTNLGLMRVDCDVRDDTPVAGHLADAAEIADLLSCICNASNMRPGIEFRPLSARAETRLFRELAASQRNICRILVSDAMLVSEVVKLGEGVEAGTVDPYILTDLDVQQGRQTPDVEALSAALAYLVDYQTHLEEGEITPEDGALALEAVSAMKLSRTAIELIAQAVHAKPELDDLRQEIETSLRVRERHRREILLEHMSLVRRQASRREAYVDDIEDLVHDGAFGLMRSIDRFEPNRGIRFMAYCQFGVRQSIGRALDDTGSLVRIPTHRAVDLRKIDRLEDGISARLPEEAVISLISKEMEIPADLIRQMRRIPRMAVPIDEILEDLSDLECPQFYDYLALQRKEVIEGLLADLPERSADVIVRRFGLRGEDEMTLEELGAIYEVTRERIRQIEAKRLDEMRHPSRQRLLRNLL